LSATSEKGDDRARFLPAGVVHRPADPRAQRQPAHDRLLPRHDPAAADLRLPAPRRRAITPRPRPARRAADRRVPGHLETDRGCSPRTRNTRLAAIRTFYRYCLLRHPEHAATIERVLQIGPKRHDRALVTYLTEPELDGLVDAPDRALWTGRRDHAIIVLLAQTGLRASELTGLACGDIHLGTGAHVATTGKGRKQRITPLTKDTVALLRTWLDERGGSLAEPLFPTSTGKPLTRKALARRITKHATHAAEQCPSVAAKTITPHVLRHTAAMRLLHADVDTTMIALWLGHEQVETTQMYLHADLAVKERALARTKPLDSKPGRYRPPHALLRFLDGL
jgi:integrase/recombinase XerD